MASRRSLRNCWSGRVNLGLLRPGAGWARGSLVAERSWIPMIPMIPFYIFLCCACYVLRILDEKVPGHSWAMGFGDISGKSYKPATSCDRGLFWRPILVDTFACFPAQWGLAGLERVQEQVVSPRSFYRFVSAVVLVGRSLLFFWSRTK